MLNKNNTFEIIILSLIIIALIVINSFQTITISEQEKTITNVNEARIRAENKPCCQIIQERYIDKRLSSDGLSFIYEEQPRIISCSDEFNYVGLGVIN